VFISAVVYSLLALSAIVVVNNNRIENQATESTN
jgi:hypothetical protein